MKPEFFCCIGGELKDTIQGIFKCSRVFIYRAAENQTIDDMLVDGFFNEADDIRVNDLIILYCPEQTRAYTFAKVSSIIGGIVKTKELDTPNLPANVSAFFNDVGYLTAADLATVALTGNLSDLNDTTITNPATGEYLRWNGAKWINMAGGGSAVWGSVGGNIADQADLQLALAGKANVDLDNLTDTGANIANWSHNVTNCVAEIPQDIKLELNAGVLTLKAGSKVYVPNGVGVFDEVTIASDISFTMTWGGNTKRLLFVKNNGTALEERQYSFSGGTAPTSEQYSLWYDTTNNAVKYTSDSGSTWSSNCSFPIAIIGNTNNVTTSIDQVFNGFGYIGSTVFALPGLKVVIPDGRNTNGTLKNTNVTLSAVTTYTQNTTGTNDVVILSDGSINIAGTNYWTYNEYKNTWVHDNNTLAMASIARSNHNTTITSFIPKTVFHAVDYSDIVDDINDESPSKLTTVEWVKNKIIASVLGDLYPVGSIYIGTQGTCPLATLIPGSTWQQIQGRYLLASGTLAGTSETYGATNTVAAGLPDIGAYVEAARRGANQTASGALYWGGSASSKAGDSGANVSWSDSLTFWADRYNSVYGQSTTVRPTAYVVNVWRRTA